MENKKPQIILIHGGDCFESNEELYNLLKETEYNPYKKKPDWKKWLKLTLSEEYEIFYPTFPNKYYADYNAWKIWFEKLFPYLQYLRYL